MSGTTTAKPVSTEGLTIIPSFPTGTTTGESSACASPEACREDWSRAVAEAAGYPITEYTGSAWVAEGLGRSFYIWATGIANQLDEERYRVVRQIDGVPIYGNNIRLAWRAHQATVWIEAGPTEDSVAPKPSELRRLVRASKAIAIR